MHCLERINPYPLDPNTVRVAYYEPAYFEHSFIMNQAEGPNRYILIAFVLNQVRLI